MGETQVASAQPFVLAFDSTHAAMAAQAAFKAAGASFALIPTPREISAGCGMSLKFKAEGAAETCAEQEKMVEVQKLREKYDFPLIFLSAKSEDIDKITGLNIGADDYITKPFGSMELLARVHSNLRRYEQILQLKKAASASQKETEEAHTLTAGGLELDLYTKQLTVDGKNVKLTPKEYAILELLMRSPGRVYSAEQIYENVWKEEAINTETIMVHVRKLREKIEVNPRNPRYLKVVWGIGYKIEK